MTDSGFSNLPPGSKLGSQRYPPSSSDRNARVERSTGDLVDVRRAIRVKGEVIAKTAENKVRVSTAQGELDLIVRANTPAPAVSEQVEIILQPGNPPRQAQIEVATNARAPQQTNERATSSEKPITERAARLTSSSQTQLSEQATSEARNASERPAPLTLDQPVRLTPLTPAEIAQVQELPVQQVIESYLSQIAFQTQSIAADALNAVATLPITSAAQDITALAQSFFTQVAVPVATLLNQAPAQEQLQTQLIDQTTTPSMQIPAPPIPPSVATTTTSSSLPAQGLQQALVPLSTETIAQNFVSHISDQIILKPDQASLLLQDTPLRIDAKVKTIAPPTIRLAQGITEKTTTRETPVTAKKKTTALEKNLAKTKARAALPSHAIIKAIQTPKAHHIHAGFKPLHASAGSLIAEVTGKTSNNLPVLRLVTPDGLSSRPFTLQFKADNITTGTRIELTPLVNTGTGALPGAFTSTALGEMLPLFQWPALEELSQTLAQPAMQSTAQTLSQTLPNPTNPARLPAAALLFVAAARSGDIGGFFNDKSIDTLRRIGKGDLLSKISRDVGHVGKLSSEPASQEWRAIPLPMSWEGELQHLMLYYKQDQDGDTDKETQSKSTRFIFDLALDRIGEIQLDGWHRHDKLDLIVRTKTLLSPDMQKSMRRTYIVALEAAGLAGELSFQGKPERFVNIDKMATL